MNKLFPEIEPYETGILAVDAPHELYFEQCGNPDGLPVVYLHGGPGGKCGTQARRFFDPDTYRIILFDQRGAGNSKPAVCLNKNSPTHLVQDIETLRNHLGIDTWHVFGGSWGSTLSLLYACAHPDKIKSLVLRGIFLNSQAEIDWIFTDNKNIFPDAYEKFVNYIPENERDDLITAYYTRFLSDDDDIKFEAAAYWSQYESTCATLLPAPTIDVIAKNDHDALSISLIEAHYFKHHVINDKDSILNKVDIFRDIPAVIVQGRYDMVCPIITAHKLHQEWPEAEFNIIPDAGHSMLEPGITSALVAATEKMKTIK